MAYVVASPIGTTLAHLRYPNNVQVRDIFTCIVPSPNRGKLHGYAAELDGDGRLLVLASYNGGLLNDVLRLWDRKEPDHQLYYGTYKNGKREGLTCLFRQGVLRLIRHCSHHGAQRVAYLVRWKPEGPSVADNLSSEENAQMTAAIKELGQLEMRIISGEKDRRDEIRAMMRKGVPWTETRPVQTPAGSRP
jgi:hypothetical protein